MKAREARALAEKKQASALPTILAQIKKVAATGAYSVVVYEPISPIIRKELNDLGYTVGDSRADSREGGFLTRINW